jgi:hypothetical protein
LHFKIVKKPKKNQKTRKRRKKMNTLNLGSDEMPEKKKKSNTRNLKIALGLAAVILVPTIGSTLAGSIAVSGGTVEFGQGVVATAACDEIVTVTPTSVLTNSMFFLNTIAVSDIDTAACDGKYFIIKALYQGTAQPMGASNATLCKFRFDFESSATATASSGADGGSCLTQGYSTTSFTFKPASAIATSLVEKITLESSSS